MQRFAAIAVLSLGIAGCVTTKPTIYVAAGPASEGRNMQLDLFECDRDARVIRAAETQDKPRNELSQAFDKSFIDVRRKKCMEAKGWREAEG